MRQPNPHFLSKPERSSLEALQRRERDKRLCDRIRVILLLDNGWSYDKIATAFFLDCSTIQRYYQLYINEGQKGLLNLNYSGSACKLSQEALDQIKAYVKEATPKTAAEVVDYIKEHFHVEYTVSAVISLLHRLNFVYKKPKLHPGKADPEKQAEFIKDLEGLEAELDDNDKILYMDGVHPQHNSKPAYGWIEKGEEKVLKANTGRQRININGALDIDMIDVTVELAESVNAQSTISLFQQLEERYPHAKRIVIICDNARYYKSALVKEYVEHSRIELRFLPPYSPNLNLIERLWRFMNKKIRDNIYYEKFSEFEEAVLSFFENVSSYRTELKGLLVKKFHIINV